MKMHTMQREVCRLDTFRQGLLNETMKRPAKTRYFLLHTYSVHSTYENIEKASTCNHSVAYVFPVRRVVRTASAAARTKVRTATTGAGGVACPSRNLEIQVKLTLCQSKSVPYTILTNHEVLPRIRHARGHRLSVHHDASHSIGRQIGRRGQVRSRERPICRNVSPRQTKEGQTGVVSGVPPIIGEGWKHSSSCNQLCR